MPVVYISGPMTGYDNLNRKEFDRAEKYLGDKGYFPLNPHNLVKHLEKPSYNVCMKIDLLALINHCEGIYMLDGWKESNGANIEYLVAKAIGLEEIY